MAYLLEHFAPSSANIGQQLFARVQQYMREDGVDDPSIFDLTPRDVVGYFMSRDMDSKGQTWVHKDNCAAWGVRNNPGCACPKRMAYSSLRTQRYQLQGYLRDQGLVAPWNASTGTGNPCNSPYVQRYLDLISEEQCAAGVETVQAALIDETVFHRVMDTTLRACSQARKDGDVVEATLLAQDAFFYALLWNSGLRAGDALKLVAGQITATSPTATKPFGQLIVDVTRAKAGVKLGSSQRVVINSDNTRYGIVKLWQIYDALLNELGCSEDEKRGPLFRNITVGDDGSCEMGARHLWSRMDKRYKAILALARIPAAVVKLVSLHSYHGSRAAREKAQGVPKAETCRNMHWSLEMYEYYTSGRTPLTIEGVTVMEDTDKQVVIVTSVASDVDGFDSRRK